ncbi:hypothetical protein AQUCO_07400039v1 [Aquilegia coerulea]|uniref:DUF4005 domain-containing protein n=1 Tax=Aquilegia coerulea TaxID=218851 RepID=A0A2G5C9F7_AQUCA|nr:hypothetical protein AQUCO_07400039v1 [Aquilegia coerulea]
MGKSPAKWIKTILLGKKASKSSSSKGKQASKTNTEKEAWVAAKEPTADFPVDPPLVSEPITGANDREAGNVVIEQVKASDFPRDEGGILDENHDADKQGTTDDLEKLRKEHAAIKAQAAFRGYLARRAFRALKGIIRLQALVRGHLARRQAIATLRCLQGIIKFQTLVRGRKAKLSDAGLDVHKKSSLKRPMDASRSVSSEVSTSIQIVKLSENAFVFKLFRSSTSMVPLRVQYGLEEPNSAWNWLERWTLSRLCEPVPQLKKINGSKSQLRQDQGRSKRTIRRAPAANVDNGVANATSETEKPKRNLRKGASNPADLSQEHSPAANVDNGVANSTSETEKPKRNLRKGANNPADLIQEHTPAANVDNAVANSTSETEKPKRNLRKGPSNPADPIQENPQNELEKVKRSLRKVSNSIVESNERLEVEIDKPKRSFRKASNPQASDSPEKISCDSAEKVTKGIVVETDNSKSSPREASCSPRACIPDTITCDSAEKKMTENVVEIVSKEPDVVVSPIPLVSNGSVDVLQNDLPPLDLQPLENVAKDESILVMNGGEISKEDQTNNDNQKTSQRRTSFSAKQENPENGLQNSPTLPSYMAATESAKAKLRGQGSPRIGQDVAEKNGFTRRLSLPSPTNGKLTSLSPRTQRLVQTNGKGGIKNDKSLLSSRDASDKVVQAGWRR